MNLNKNYYTLLGVANSAEEKVIKKAYYKLSFQHHPDKGGDPAVFAEMTEAYDVLCSDQRKDYDMKSRFGNNYNEYYEFFDINVEIDYDTEKDRLEKFKRNEVLDIYMTVGDDFDGSIEYERWVRCKTCDGTGKDMSSKIVIRDNDGNILKVFDGEDGCDFCEGSGKYMGMDCSFCDGKGKIGLNPCKSCSGEKRILGKQKLSKIKLTGERTKVDAMGHVSKTEAGKVGCLIILCKGS
jgi:DnaJ family protein A protein 2